MTASWFVTQISRPQAPHQLFCLPHAGAGAAAYVEWPKALGPDVEVNAFIPAGRERRVAETPAVDPVPIAAAIAARADRPFALFGHSLGGLVAYEIVRELRRTGGPMPVHLFVSGCTPPDAGRLGTPFEGLSGLDDQALLARLAEHGSLPAEILAETALIKLILPGFRADFAWLDAYEYTGEPPLPVPITVFAGDADQEAPADRMDGWRRHTDAEAAVHLFAGGHFFLQEHQADLAQLIRTGLTQAAIRAAP